MTKKQKRIVGDVIKIDLGDGVHTYARVLGKAVFAFYDIRTSVSMQIDEIICCPVLFKVPVMDHAVTRGRWVVVGHAPLDDSLLRQPKFFMQDIARRDKIRIYEDGKMRPATRDECAGLERAAVWEPAHVEERVRDHFAGRKNRWLESLLIK